MSDESPEQQDTNPGPGPRSLVLDAFAAVTAVGLTAAQTCAAIRAGVRRFSPIEAQILPEDEPQVGARVSADPRLRADAREWLLNLAARALREALAPALRGPETALLWLVPEAARQHPLSATASDDQLLASLVERLGHPLSPASRVVRSGAAGCVEALGYARELLDAGEVARCVIGGADSLLRPHDLDRLRRDRRLLGPKQSQGLVPGEGAAFVVVARPDPEVDPDVEPAPVYVHGLGVDYERNTVAGTAYSVGEAFASALTTALEDAGRREAEIAFVASNHNGERYDAWETAHTHARAYRTRRERLAVHWPASSTGEIGVASGALAILSAANAIAHGYAAGPLASVQLRSEGDLRGVAIVGR